MLSSGVLDLFSMTKFKRQRLSAFSIVFNSTRNLSSAANA